MKRSSLSLKHSQYNEGNKAVSRNPQHAVMSVLGFAARAEEKILTPLWGGHHGGLPGDDTYWVLTDG